ncbi:MAG: ABC transporter ATP-binding protein, partial [Chlamydiia bacterium]|nr:ABC transporter ATP-binding protein [Chlamydiia bacterium]
QEKFTSVLIDSLAGIQTVKIFGMEQFSLEKYKMQNEQMAHLETKTAKYDLLTRPILHTITTICLVLVVLSGLYVFKMNIAELFSFCGLLYLAYEPIKKFADTNTNIQKGVVAAERLFEVLNIKPDLIDDPKATPLKSFKESISFDNVSFRYGEDWVLRDVSFNVKKGETVALVGATGAGKSTIVQLLPRLYDVQKGKITIDGKPLQTYTQKSLREQIAFVSQKPFLFYDTIASNISFGRNFSREEIIDAAKRAHAAEFIDQLPLGYDTPLAETGKNLSGGQQQRLAIARALVKKAPILILDEATSSLDAISELRIKEAIHELHGEVTQIIIAHRLSTIEHADRIIYFEHGRKLAEGTREELLTTCKPFKLLWETHFRRLEPASL